MELTTEKGDAAEAARMFSFLIFFFSEQQTARRAADVPLVPVNRAGCVYKEKGCKLLHYLLATAVEKTPPR